MILLEIIGGTQNQRDIADSAIRHFIKTLLPKKRKLEVEIVIKDTLLQEAVGFCEKISAIEYKIEVYNRGSLYEFLATLAHEMVHVKQYCKKELQEIDTATFWYGKDHSHLAYEDQPWEKEAFAKSYKLAKEYLTKEMEVSVEESKTLSPRTIAPLDVKKEKNHIKRTRAKIAILKENS